MTPLTDVARAMLASALASVQPQVLLRRLSFLPAGVAFEGNRLAPAGRFVLISCGKAGGELAATCLRSCLRRPDELFVLVPSGAPVPSEVAEHTRRGEHPTPSATGAAATRELLALLNTLGPDDGVLLLLSGGASALLAEPLPGVDLAHASAVTAALLRAGATIGELNAVRKHLFAALGGRLAASCAGEMLTLALSDVPCDDLCVIASGPTVADPSSFADATDALARRGVAANHREIVQLLAAGSRGLREESPKPGDPRLARSRAALLGNSALALEAAAAVATQAGFRPLMLTRRLRGEARVVGLRLAELARSISAGEAVACLLAGETTVTVRGDGCGGRNLELALAAAQALAGVPERCLLAAGSDGIDGCSPAAGAVVDGATLARGHQLGRDADQALADNDSWSFFAGLPDAIVTGPTGTNVADLVFILASGQVPAFLTEAYQLAIHLPTLAGRLSPRRTAR